MASEQKGGVFFLFLQEGFRVTLGGRGGGLKQLKELVSFELRVREQKIRLVQNYNY